MVYAKQTSMIVASVNVDPLDPNRVSLTSRVLEESAQDARAVTSHFEQGLVFYSDVSTDLIYSTSAREASDWREVTANTRRVEGLAIDWRSDVLYWSDNDLEYIMAAKVTGHLHRKHVEDTGKAQGIAVDPINNRYM